MKSKGKKALYCVFVGLLMSSVLNAAPKKKNSKDIYKNIVKEKEDNNEPILELQKADFREYEKSQRFYISSKEELWTK